MKKIVVTALLIILLIPVLAQDDVSFRAKAKTPVRVGERFRVTFTVNAEGENFRPPDFEHFKVLSGPNTSSRSSIQIINGKVSRSVNYEYYYTLEALEKGAFEIDAATIDVDGKTYESNKAKVQVVESNTSSQSRPGQSGSSGTSRGQAPTANLEDDMAFLRAEVDNASPYQGEQVMVTYKLYYRVDIADYGISQSPSYPGCWSQDITEDDNQRSRYTETVNGKRYYVADIFKEAIFPQRSGEITSKPMQFKIVARVREQSNDRRSRDPFESFFDHNFGYKNVRKTLNSNPVKLDVKPLPSANKPASFNGAVGEFSFSSDIDKNQVQANNAINLEFKVSGRGNLKLIDPPKIDFPPDFEVYDPEVRSNIKASARSGVSGSKTFKYLVIPRVSGEYTIEPVEFTYYDLNRDRYITRSSPAFTINVTKGEENQGTVAYKPSSQEEIQYLGKDIRFIYTKPLALQKAGEYFYGSMTFFLLLIIPFVLLIVIVLLVKYYRRRSGNVALQKERKATGIARKRLKKSQKLMKEKQADAFYEELADAVWGYISDKFNIPLSQLSMDTVRERLEDKKIDDAIIQEFIDTLEECEFARFAPGDKDKRMEDIYKKANDVIIKTEKQLK